MYLHFLYFKFKYKCIAENSVFGCTDIVLFSEWENVSRHKHSPKNGSNFGQSPVFISGSTHPGQSLHQSRGKLQPSGEFWLQEQYPTF